MFATVFYSADSADANMLIFRFFGVFLCAEIHVLLKSVL